MKLNEKIIYRDDNYVDYSRKKRVTRRNYKISGKYDHFSPEDIEVNTKSRSFNPSINKRAWKVSGQFETDLNWYDDRLNKCQGQRHANIIREMVEDEF